MTKPISALPSLVGVEDADMTRLSQIVVHPSEVKRLNFQEMFIWLSASMQKFLNPNQTTSSTAPPGWG